MNDMRSNLNVMPKINIKELHYFNKSNIFKKIINFLKYKYLTKIKSQNSLHGLDHTFINTYSVYVHNKLNKKTKKVRNEMFSLSDLFIRKDSVDKIPYLRASDDSFNDAQLKFIKKEEKEK